MFSGAEKELSSYCIHMVVLFFFFTFFFFCGVGNGLLWQKVDFKVLSFKDAAS